jgi:hypothetical protein
MARNTNSIQGVTQHYTDLQERERGTKQNRKIKKRIKGIKFKKLFIYDAEKKSEPFSFLKYSLLHRACPSS